MSNPVKIPCVVERVIYHNDKVSSVFLRAESKIPKFIPGQFLHFALDEYDPSSGFWPDSRVFSIASSPKDNYIRITYSVKGAFTQRMYNEIKEGNRYWIKLPYGHFIINESSKDVILIAGGTGITPFISYLLSRDSGSKNLIHLFYGIREERLFIFNNEIVYAYNKGNIKLYLYCEEGSFELSNGIVVNKGIINKEDAIEVAKNNLSSTIMISGPQSMINYFVDNLVSNNINRERILLDEWE
jgi:ferredoxin-NADP reductase